MKKRFWIPMICAAVAGVSVGTACAEAITFSESLSGEICYPADSTPETASYVYRYHYPLADGEGDVAAAINEQYRYMVYDAESFAVPITAESIEGLTDQQAWTEVTGTVTCLTEDYASVLVVSVSDLGDGGSLIWSSQTYPLNGAKAGSVTSLPYLLGILERSEEADEWLEERQAAKAEACVQRMVWEMISEELADQPEAFYEDLDFDWLCGVFYPEDDFYLNEAGDFVFYIEPGTIAPYERGVLTYTFSLDDILDEL